MSCRTVMTRASSCECGGGNAATAGQAGAVHFRQLAPLCKRLSTDRSDTFAMGASDSETIVSIE